jgi:two-component system, chemotaxis family, sensor histidine kinase and response regulator PixL
MDIVRDRLKQVHGEIQVKTDPGRGTTFTISVPFTLSVTRVLLAESNRMLMAFPMDAIEEMLVLQPEQIITALGGQVFNWQGSMVQLVRLSRWLKFNCPRQVESLETAASVNVPSVLMMNLSGQRVGIEIDSSWGEQEVAVRQVEGGLPLPPGFNNCTILGDGRVVPLVNTPELLRWIASQERFVAQQPVAVGAPELNGSESQHALNPDQPTILIVDDSVNVRRLLALTLERAGYQVAQAKDGQDALDKLATGLGVKAIICDIEMPRLDGFGFLARFRSNTDYAAIPVTMLTTRSGEKHRQLAMSLGATAYVSKPFNEQSLLQTLEELIAA